LTTVIKAIQKYIISERIALQITH